MKIVKLLCILSISYLLLSCGGEVSGSGTVTTNGVSVKNSDGELVENAEVKIIESRHWAEKITHGSSPVTATAFTDKDGFVSLEGYSGNVVLQVSHGDEVGISFQAVDTIALEEGVTLSGIQSPHTHLIAGTAFQTIPDSDSTLKFLNIPKGLFSFYEMNDKQELLYLERIELYDDSIHPFVYTDTMLLFDDFFGGFQQNPLKEISYDLQWYLFSDSATAMHVDGDWIEGSANDKGNSYCFAADTGDGTITTGVFLGSKNSNAFGGLGVLLKGSSSTTGYNFTELDSVVMRIRGTGVMRLSIETAKLDLQESSHYGYDISLYESWNEITISIDELHLVEMDSLIEVNNPWATVASNVKRIEFLYRSDANNNDTEYWFEIDEIRLYGMTVPF